jgi:hypothetical protein
MSIFNNLNAGPTQPAPYQQPDYRIPSASMLPATFPVGANIMNISQPVAAYVQPGSGVDTQPGWANSGGAGPTVV